MRLNSTTTKPVAANKPRRKAPTYQTARELKLTFEGADANARELLIARMFAMAEHLLEGPASEMLIELLYIACGKAWQYNRQNLSVRTGEAITIDNETITRNVAMLRVIEFVRGHLEDDEIREELDDLTRRKDFSVCASARRTVVNIDEWKAMSNWRRAIANV